MNDTETAEVASKDRTIAAIFDCLGVFGAVIDRFPVAFTPYFVCEQKDDGVFVASNGKDYVILTGNGGTFEVDGSCIRYVVAGAPASIEIQDQVLVEGDGVGVAENWGLLSSYLGAEKLLCHYIELG